METKSPHFWWIISLLSVIIIALIAFILTERTACAEIISEYISYASVILSITLSVFAILYTYTSNVQIQQQFEKINSAANNIREASTSLITTNNRLNDSLNTIMDRLGNIDESQNEMRAQLNNMNNQIPNLEAINSSNDWSVF